MLNWDNIHHFSNFWLSWHQFKGACERHSHSLLEFGEHDGVIKEEQVSVLDLGVYADPNTPIQHQLAVLGCQAKDEWTLLRGHPEGGFLPENMRDGDGLHFTHERRQEQLFGWLRRIEAKVDNIWMVFNGLFG